MEHIAALLLVIGCSGDYKQCEELPAPVPVYETAEECASDLPVAIRDLSGARVKILAGCIAVDPALEEEDAELVWDVTPSGELQASVGVADVVIAAASDETVRQ